MGVPLAGPGSGTRDCEVYGPRPDRPRASLTCPPPRRGGESEPERARLLADPGRRELLGARGAVLRPLGWCRERLQERRSRLGEEPRLAGLTLGCISNQLSETRPPEPESRNAQPSLPGGRARSPRQGREEAAGRRGELRPGQA